MYQRLLKFWIILGILVLALTSNSVFSQYRGERVLEKTFEQEVFFFNQNYLNPFGLGNFAQTTAGLVDDPFLNLAVNPANWSQCLQKKAHFYMDFRTIHKNEQPQYFIQPAFDRAYASPDVLYPAYYVETKEELLPIFSAGFLTSPFKILGRQFHLGLTYQAIFQDEDYYYVPFSIYRSHIGYDYAGNRMAESSDIPVIDRYRGEDKMHQTGHFLSLYSGLDLTNKITLGIRLNRTLFDRDGSYGSKNFWDSSYYQNYTSVYYNMEEREQSYQHWDFSGGLRFQPTDKISVGVSSGYLWGDVTQTLTGEDSSNYRYGEMNESDNWSYYNKSGSSSEFWDHDGKTYFAGFDFNYKFDQSKKLNFYYKYKQQDVDIYLSAALDDTSYSTYQHVYNENTYYYENEYALLDQRNGSGTRSVNSHKLMTAFQWKIEHDKKLNLGLHVDVTNQQTLTEEAVFGRNHYEMLHRTSDDPSEEYYYNANIEEKNLQWDFQTELVQISIPLIFEWRLSKTTELILGLNRSMSSWKLEEVTLAKYQYRERTTDSDTDRDENFIERYKMPTEKRTDVKTTFLGGLNITPSDHFSVRMLMVPNFEDTYAGGSELRNLQWWIGVNLTP